MKHSRKRKQFFLFVMDFAILYGALYLALFLRNGVLPGPSLWHNHLVTFSFAFIGWAVIFYTAGLYALEAPFDGARFAGRLLVAMTISTLGTALMFYLMPGVPIAPKTILFLFAATGFVFVWLWRYAYGKLARISPIRFSVAFIGATDEALYLADIVKQKPYLGYSLAFVYDEKGRVRDESFPSMNTPEALREELKARIPDLFVMSDGGTLSDGARRLLFELIGRGARYEGLPDFFETLVRRVPIDVINEAWFLENIDLKTKRPYLILKRVIDIALGVMALVVSAPLWPLIVLGIRVESKGPIIFKQMRLGHGKNAFTIYKFRTMRIEGNDFIPTTVGDSRVTRIGKILRATRLDELPQMLNILKGDMSFVGPRPERPELAEELAKAI
ncbi:MAG: hypothetical protein E4H20_12235, partial [Spirochaetales bacterium]